MKFFGKEVSVNQVGLLCGSTRDGTSPLGIKKAAESLDLEATAYKADTDQLKRREISLYLTCYR